jgi:hypothetical protein
MTSAYKRSTYRPQPEITSLPARYREDNRATFSGATVRKDDLVAGTQAQHNALVPVTCSEVH